MSASSTPSVAYDAHAFTINGERVLLLSAGIHYFRVPRALWADRIAKAKRGGMNTIETYVAWNHHEPEQGRWEWDGEKDFGAFMDECARQGMYVIARPGPYICAEWDFGGFPAWLANVPGIQFRKYNQPYLAAVDRYMDQVVPIIARRQHTKGGPVILVQVENEYGWLHQSGGNNDTPTDDAYQHHLRDGLIRRGIDVPLITCVGGCTGTVECINDTNPAHKMPEFRQKYPNNPLFVTEFWTGWYDSWGLPHHTRTAEDIEYASLRCFSEGASGYNYYMYHGGTNFGYTAFYRQTTSYDYDAQISETGRLTDKWRTSRRVALWAKAFAPILLNGTHTASVPATQGLQATEVKTAQQGAIVFVYNPDKEQAITGSVLPALPEVTLGPRQILPWVHDAPIGEAASYLSAYAGLVKSDARVLSAHIRPDPHQGARVYVYGEPGEIAEVVLFNSGERGQSTLVSFVDAPRVYNVGASQIVALTTAQADRVWFPDEKNALAPVVVGPDDIREHTHTATGFVGEFAPGRSHTVALVHADGTLGNVTIDAPALPVPPTLGAWETVAEPNVAAPDFPDVDGGGWQEMDEPTSMLKLGNGSNGYGWYRATVEMPEETDAELHFAACSDRLTLWVNGDKVGSSDIPPEDRKTEWEARFDVRLRAGANVLCVLVTNLGLIKGDWQINKPQEQEQKGIYGPVTLTPSGNCYVVDVHRWWFRGQLHGERDGWAKANAVWPTDGEPAAPSPVRWHRTTFTIDTPLDSATPLLARLDGMGQGVLWLNGIHLGRYWQIGPQRDYYLPEPYLKVGEPNVLTLAETEGNMPESVSLVWDEKSASVVSVMF